MTAADENADNRADASLDPEARMKQQQTVMSRLARARERLAGVLIGGEMTSAK